VWQDAYDARIGAPLPAPVATPAGWYPDPWTPGGYRWWDGRAWTGHVARPKGAVETGRKPRLPAWLSIPVLVSLVPVVPLLVFSLINAPVPILASFVPILFVAPVLVWLDRVEPEPRPARWHAFLWGATVSILVAGTINTIVALTISETAAVAVSAPLVEESIKGLAVVWALRRREIDGLVDGLVYAGWAALGFAVVENTQYFVAASDDGVLAQTFVARAVLTPFAHPLFTAWIGLAVGAAVAAGRSTRAAWWRGWVPAVALHAAWNGSITAASLTGEAGIIAVAALAFVAIFVVTIVQVVRMRRREERSFVAAVPLLIDRYALHPDEIRPYGRWREVHRARQALPREQRADFDDFRTALARLASLHGRDGGPDPAEEARLREQLERARHARQHH
jgi:RsiW-degrading membrane proteinase PrsW (M82 family)